MDWLALALALVKMLGAFAGFLHDRQMVSAGQAAEIAAALKGQSDALNKAIAAREAVRGDIAAHPDRVRDHDEFERP